MYITKKISKAGKPYLAICFGDLIISFNIAHMCMLTGMRYAELNKLEVGERIQIEKKGE